MRVTIELRMWSESDAEGLLRAAESDDLSTQFGTTDLTTVEACSVFIAENLISTDPSARNFAISIDGIAVGNVGVGNIEHRHETGWVYYWLSRDARGRGIAASALASVAEWAFSEGGLYRLELGHRTNNPASCRVAERASFAAEGIERQKLRYGQERFDVETHARLRTDIAPSVELFPIV